MSLPLIAASVLLLLQTGKALIEGTVVSSTTNRPVAGAQVTATRIGGVAIGATPAGQNTSTITTGVLGGFISATGGTRVVAPGAGIAPVQISPVTTDSSGHFRFADLEPGNYMLRALADGYARQEFNPQVAGRQGMTAQVSVAAGEAKADAVLHLTPGGTVSGRVTGSNGESLVNMEVSLLRAVYNPDGRKTLQQSGAAQTNDRGEYRLFWATPGRYYLSVAGSNRPIPGVPFNPTATNKYPRTFYPSTTDAATAAMINIEPASELSGMDFRLIDQPTYNVRGRLVDSITGQLPPRGVAISIMPRESIVNTGLSSSGAPYNAADGTFELKDVPSGAYVIRAQLPFNSRPEPGQPFPTPPTATAMVDVSGGDVDGVILNLVPPMSISGRVRIEGDPSIPQNVGIFMRPAEPGPGGGPRPPQWGADGTFKIEGVVPGTYLVTVNAPQVGGQPAYVKEARFGGADILGHPLAISGPVPDEITIVLAKNTGQIKGAVRNDSQKTPSAAQVVLIPDQRDRYDLYKVTGTDPAGNFTFRALPPGSYKAFAWQDIERNSWFDPAVMRAYEQNGVPVRVENSSDLTLDLRIIPAIAR